MSTFLFYSLFFPLLLSILSGWAAQNRGDCPGIETVARRFPADADNLEAVEGHGQLHRVSPQRVPSIHFSLIRRH
jgi:hypothetical protein